LPLRSGSADSALSTRGRPWPRRAIRAMVLAACRDER
jgi:hypothetical protein